MWLRGVDRNAPAAEIAAGQAPTVVKNRPSDGANAAPLPAVKAWNSANANSEEVPEAVNELWKRMTTRAGYTNVFADLKQNMVELLGQSYGESNFNAILKRYGRKDPDEFVSGQNRSFAEARQCARDLYRSVQELMVAQKTENAAGTAELSEEDEAEFEDEVQLVG
jgi:hypothetical protein